MKRECNFEVLRTLSMFLIIIYHFCTHGIGSVFLFDNNDNVSLFNYIFCNALLVLSSTCVNLYVLISGYFLTYAEFKISRIVRTWILVCFYSFVITLSFYIFSQESIGIIPIVKSFFPLSTDHYWFVTQYLGMLLLSPFLGILSRCINRQQYVLLLIVYGFICLSLFHDFPLGKRYHVAHGNSVLFFCYLFFVSGYIRRFVSIESSKNIVASIIIVFMVFLIWTLCEGRYHLFWFDYNSMPFVFSVLIFVLFTKIKLQSFRFARILAKIAPYTFAVYLIHDHLLVRDLLWTNLHLQVFCNKAYFSIILIGVCGSVFTVGICLDWVRKALFNMCDVDKLIMRIDTLIHFPDENEQ